MKGMELSKAYFEEYGREMIDSRLSMYREYMAVGLVGEGSECFGFDDQLSTDHDFGPAFCIWIPENLYDKAGAAIQEEYDRLPRDYMGYRRVTTAQGGGRVGLLTTEGFYRKFMGLDRAPADNMEWFRIPEHFLATAVNGQVFMDNFGEFSRIRTRLQAFYPEDVLKKKLAARCAVMAQSGQYNYGRSIKRGDSQAAYLACGEFVKTAMSALYLLNDTYMPYYKWVFRGAAEFTVLRDSLKRLKEITLIPDSVENGQKKEHLIESVCVDIGRELNRRGFTRTTEAFLQAHGEELMRNIGDNRLRNLHIMIDCG